MDEEERAMWNRAYPSRGASSAATSADPEDQPPRTAKEMYDTVRDLLQKVARLEHKVRELQR